ncbi:anaerobic ribonucleoside-triphosphate reductase activating protein [Prevotella intermedia]|uniref:Anaerobic ribonucleoside-triphosphate reductase activating protein n=1 Tax=Prevotella intermedia TaxID=28131 RepID=A0A2D3N9D5_PREIN|nr:anaerobic ribonucleoside-triphosphate reductase activating protein [Prevotella intermedia]ATV52051.1 anaerobic ribonucleoside-triphosphate reductase activating protein [Prevotella intermedia]
MLKFVDTDIVFQEFPDEVTLAINLSNCPCRCPGCHSTFLWKDVGNPLTTEAIEQMLAENSERITCIGFMGGDSEPEAINSLAAYIRTHHAELKVGWYTGRTTLSPDIQLPHFDYIKIGPYIRHLGGLDSRRTNQRMYRITKENKMNDITNLFWKK